MKTKDLVIIATFAALSMVLSMFVFFKLPMGGSVSLYLVPIILLALKKDLKVSMTCAAVVVTLQIVTGSYIIGIPQVILDYILPVMFVSSISVVRNSPFAIQFTYIVCITIAGLLSHTVSGILYFGTDFKASVAYNVSHFIPTMIVCTLIVYLIKDRIKM